ncbi:MAG: glycoside hydrolase family 9 protein [Chloroflexi bacterium]|nr:glycoside hydrolase family 9 protein [Chloroflexota bacterium]
MQPLDFSDLQRPGEYRIIVPGDPGVASPWFRIGPAWELVEPLIGDTVTFFQTQRDGPDVIPGDLGRKPSHLNDRAAAVYQWPDYPDPDSEAIDGDLTPLVGRTDLAGGWFDAGNFIKFSHTTAYADALLWTTQRKLGAAAPETLIPEARSGLDWLAKAWHPDTCVLDLQVCIGAGDIQGTYVGDHDLWRLPETDDALTGGANRYLSHRPAFAANAPGAPVPPNLAGRVAAAFALAAQVTAATDPARATKLLDGLRAQLDGAVAQADTDPFGAGFATDEFDAVPHAFGLTATARLYRLLTATTPTTRSPRSSGTGSSGPTRGESR